MDLKTKVDNNEIILGDFNTPLQIDHPDRKSMYLN